MSLLTVPWRLLPLCFPAQFSPDGVKLKATDILLSITQHDVAALRDFLLHQVTCCRGENQQQGSHKRLTAARQGS